MKKQICCFVIAFAIIFNIGILGAFSVSQPVIAVSSVSGNAGDVVKVDIKIDNNTGLASLVFNVAYGSALTLQGVEFNSEFGPYATTPPTYKNPQKITLVSPYADVTTNGIFATLTFKIADNATEGKYDVSVAYVPNETYNSNFENVAITVENGCVTVGSSASANTMNLIVGQVSGKPGEIVKVDVAISDNPGLASLVFNVAYGSALTLQGVEFNSEFGPYATTPPTYKNPQKITLVSPYADVTTNGVFATLTFKIADNAIEGKYDISVTYIPNETYNSNFENVAVTVENGSVTVSPAVLSGGVDIDTDGDVDEVDAEVLLKYITGWDITVNEAVADVNGDGEVNVRDAAVILQYLAGKRN